MYLQKKDILKRLDNENDDLIIRPLLDREEQIGELTIDLRLGTDFLVSFRGRDPYLNASCDHKSTRPIKSFFDTTRRKFGQNILLHPNQTVLCSTLEYLKLPKNVFATLSMRSSLSRLGLTISTILQPGYCGCASIELTNINVIPIKLTVGMRFVQARLFEIAKDATYTYSKRKYVGQVRPEPSKITEDKDLEILKNLHNSL